MTASPRSRPRTAPDSYDDIEPHFARLAALPAGGPARARQRDRIITLCLPLAEHIARRFSGRGEPLDDLTQVARLGLVKAVDRFDVGLGSPFVAFAVPTIMGEVRRHFRDRTWALRVPRTTKELQQRLNGAVETLAQRLGRMPRTREIAAELGVDVVEVTHALVARDSYRADSLDAPDAAEDGAAAEPGAREPCYALVEDAMAVRPLLRAMPERERRILVWRFYDNLTQSQIAERLGVSQMQVSRILAHTLRQLREQALADPRPLAA